MWVTARLIPFRHFVPQLLLAIVQTGVKVTPRYAKWMGRLKEVRHRGRPWHNRIVMSYTRQFVEEEQKEMLGLNHNLGDMSMHLEVRLMDNPRKGDTV